MSPLKPLLCYKCSCTFSIHTSFEHSLLHLLSQLLHFINPFFLSRSQEGVGTSARQQAVWTLFKLVNGSPKPNTENTWYDHSPGSSRSGTFCLERLTLSDETESRSQRVRRTIPSRTVWSMKEQLNHNDIVVKNVPEQSKLTFNRTHQPSQIWSHVADLLRLVMEIFDCLLF